MKDSIDGFTNIENSLSVFVIIVCFVFLSNPSISKIYAETEETTNGNLPSNFFEKDISDVYWMGMIMKEGVYYTLEGDYYIPKPLPKPGTKCIITSYTERLDEAQRHYTYYYLVESENFKGWVPDDYIANGSFNGEVNVDKLNVREKPAINSSVIKTLKKGDIVDIINRSSKPETINEITGYWVSIYTQGYEIGEKGWVFEPYITLLISYSYLQMTRNFSDNESISSSVIIQVVSEIIALPDRPLISWNTDGNLCEEDNTTFHSQMLYNGCYMLIHNATDSDNPQVLKTALDWITILENEYPDKTIWTEFSPYIKPPIAPESALLKMTAYEKMKNKEKYEETLINTLTLYGIVEYIGFEYNSYYGLELIYKLIKAKETFGSDFVLEILDKIYEKAPGRLLKSAVLYHKGELLSEIPGKKEEAISVLNQVIDEYPEEEWQNFMWYSNFAQFAMLDAIKLFQTEEERGTFIKPYTEETTPFPVRYFALYLLAYGEEGLLPYGDNGLIEPDPKYQKIFDEIILPEDKQYWFNQ